jgi:SAM-dependent methyltransferase
LNTLHFVEFSINARPTSRGFQSIWVKNMKPQKDKAVSAPNKAAVAKTAAKTAEGILSTKQTKQQPKTAKAVRISPPISSDPSIQISKSMQERRTNVRKVAPKADPALSKGAVIGTESAQGGRKSKAAHGGNLREPSNHAIDEQSSHSEGLNVMLSETQQPIADQVLDAPIQEEAVETAAASTQTGGQDEIDSRNSSFWDELCGTHLASSLGVVDNGKESLSLFDKWFFDIYPYLDKHLDLPSLKGKRVLEIGLGYGTVGQYLAEHCEEYMGLDIAAGPVNMMRHRMQQNGLNGDATQGSILDAPFPDQSFDVIVALGCLHHSGDLQRAFNECRRLLKPGGRLTLMVYYAYSYRRFEHQFAETWDYLGKELMGYRGVIGVTDAAARAAADTNAKGEAAPHTDWVGAASLKTMLKRAGFKHPKTTLENIDQAGPYVKVPREDALKSRWPAIWGLDIYASAWAK